MERIFLGGTTHGTTWRSNATNTLLELGVDPSAIVNPHLPAGTRYTPEYARWEDEVKEDPGTIVFIHLCLSVVIDPALNEDERRFRQETVGPISTLEIGMFAFSEPERTAVVLNTEGFTENGQPLRIMRDIAARLRHKYGEGSPPLFDTLDEAMAWASRHLPHQPSE